MHVHTQIDRGPCTPGAVSLACRQRAQRDFKLDAGGCAWFRARASTPAGSRLPSRQLHCQQYLRDARRPAGYRRGRKRHATQKRVRVVHSSIAHGEFAVMIAWSSLLWRCLLTAANNDGAAPLSRPAKLLTEMSAFRFYRHRDTCLAVERCSACTCTCYVGHYLLHISQQPSWIYQIPQLTPISCKIAVTFKFSAR